LLQDRKLGLVQAVTEPCLRKMNGWNGIAIEHITWRWHVITGGTEKIRGSVYTGDFNMEYGNSKALCEPVRDTLFKSQSPKRAEWPSHDPEYGGSVGEPFLQVL
jgi:hypothetical protein